MIFGSFTYCLFFKVFKNDLFLHFYLRFIGNFACLSCDGKWDEHVVLYEDEELRKELGKPVGEAFYPLSDVPEIQQQFLKANLFQKGYFLKSEYPLFCKFLGKFPSKSLL